jgi:hypothetical protein
MENEIREDLIRLSNQVQDTGRCITRASDLRELRILHKRLLMHGKVLDSLIEIEEFKNQ